MMYSEKKENTKNRTKPFLLLVAGFVAAIVLTVHALVKRLETRMVLLIAGFAMCAAAGEPLKAFQAFNK